MIDDMFIVETSHERCTAAMDTAEAIFAALGLTSAHEKREGPNEEQEFVGALITPDEAFISQERISEAADFLSATLVSQSVHFDEMRAWMGRLSWYSLIIRGARARMRHMWDWLNEHTRIHGEQGTMIPSIHAASGMRWWIGLQHRRHVGSRLLLQGCRIHTQIVKSDGSGSARWCCITGSRRNVFACFGQLTGSDALVQCQVPFFELAAVYEACIQFAQFWTGRLVVFGVDSWPIMNAIDSGSSADPDLMRLLRGITSLQERFRFDVVSVHCIRDRNQLSDCGTRRDITNAAQAFRPFLQSEGIIPDKDADSPQAYHNDSMLNNAFKFCMRLGHRSRTRSSCLTSPKSHQ